MNVREHTSVQIDSIHSADLQQLFEYLAWCYKIAFGLILYLNLRTFLSGALLQRGHAAIVSNFIKEIARTDPELYFSRSLLLMYGTNCLSLLIVHCVKTVSYTHLTLPTKRIV